MPKTEKPLRRRRLRTLNDCVRAGGWLWNELALDLIEPAKAGKLAFLLNIQKGILLLFFRANLKNFLFQTELML